MLHHKLPAEPNCSHSTRQSIHSRQLKSNFHSIRLAPDCELGERGRRATFSWPKPHATEAERPCAYDAVRARPLCTDRSAALRPQWLSSARARSPELGAAGGHGSNKGLTGRSVQEEGTAVEVQRPSGARAMGYSFIGSYQSASGALPLCDPRPRPSGASGLKRASFYTYHWRGGGEVSSTSKPPLKGGNASVPETVGKGVVSLRQRGFQRQQLAKYVAAAARFRCRPMWSRPRRFRPRPIPRCAR